jgi:hypothetical protein
MTPIPIISPKNANNHGPTSTSTKLVGHPSDGLKNDILLLIIGMLIQNILVRIGAIFGFVK